MAIERTHVFLDGRVFLLTATINRFHFALSQEPNEQNQRYLEANINQLSELKWCTYIDPDEFMTDPVGGTEMPLDLWFYVYGLEDEAIEWAATWPGEEEMSVGTWGMGIDIESPCGSVIDSEDEEELVIGVDVLVNLLDEYGMLEDDDEFIS